MKIFIFEKISDETVVRVLQDIIEAKESESDTITVYINSTGGDVDAGYAIYEALRLSGKKIITYAVNYCYSCAVLLYLSGDERYATNHSSFLLHEPRHLIDREILTRKKYEERIKELTEHMNVLFTKICERSNLTVKKINSQIKESKDGDWYFQTEEATKLGIVHSIGLP